MSRSKHQTRKGVMDGQSKRGIDLMFAERDHDAMEWVAKRQIKKDTLNGRRAAKMGAESQED
ncbi:hypothetical protein [Altericroceibacterium endophyticum]|uniref:Uncharacterized protein n=1 Tax=Altericroceibacterium endophyticum TaxID=1808508 RepID=A0A6I4T6W4_9SPHN|nr:hypothetical protein [Altericroceibacterium endophyticum]MXO65851.1 hypothetical protein [Altericroceibacterium endophyticum]